MTGHIDLASAVGKRIADLVLGEETPEYLEGLWFTFEDDSTVILCDVGQSCCEHRFMRTDDDLSKHIGATLQSAEVRDAPSIEDSEGNCHDVEFLVVTTSNGAFTMSSHNKHNGYYGGFDIRCVEVDRQ